MEKIKNSRIILISILLPVFIALIPYAAIAGDHLHKHSCNTDEILRFNGTDWECSTDYDTLYDLACASGQVAKWNDATSEWQCADENGTTSSITTEEGLRIVRGNVDADGTILEGVGFTVDRLTGTDPTGQYIVTFDAPFSDNPTPLVTSARLYRIASVVSIGTGGFVVIFYQATSATPKIDSSFYFVAVGPQ